MKKIAILTLINIIVAVLLIISSCGKIQDTDVDKILNEESGAKTESIKTDTNGEGGDINTETSTNTDAATDTNTDTNSDNHKHA